MNKRAHNRLDIKLIVLKNKHHEKINTLPKHNISSTINLWEVPPQKPYIFLTSQEKIKDIF